MSSSATTGTRRDTASVDAFFRRAVATSGVAPITVVSDHHQPYLQAVHAIFPEATHVRTGLHRAYGETTKPIERSHLPTRGRLRASRGLKTTAIGQHFFEGFEALQALVRGHVLLAGLTPASSAAGATPHERARAVAKAVTVLGTRLRRAA
jgi:transposase-like protein